MNASTLSYSRRIARLRARIFGDIVRKTNAQQYKVVQYFAQRPWQKDLPKWYPPTDKFSSLLFHLQHLGLYNDEHLYFSNAMEGQRKARGKGGPSKGQGKRAKKGKTK